MFSDFANSSTRLVGLLLTISTLPSGLKLLKTFSLTGLEAKIKPSNEVV